MEAMSRQYPAWNFQDMLSRMPRVAQRKYKTLCTKLEDVEALLKNHMEREKEANDRVYDFSRRADLAHGNADEVRRLTAEHTQAVADCEELFADRGKLNATHANLSNIVSRLRHTDIPIIHELGMAPVNVAAQPNEGETLVEAVDRTRAELHQRKGQLAATRAAPLPREELLNLARVAVNDLALAGAPAVITASGQFKIHWDRMAVTGYPAASDSYSPRLFAALFPDQVYELLVRQIANMPGISAVERAERGRELELEILRLEHAEESLIAQAQARGVDILRRVGASAFALLSCDPGEPHVMVQAAE
jgi:hypothetical protein